MENKWLEPAVEAYKKYFGDTANIIFDIGTRDGDDAQYFVEQLNANVVYAFDPSPSAVYKTKSRYPNFNVVESAVGQFTGQTTFTQIISRNADEEGCSSMEIIHNFPNAQYEKLLVPITRFDIFLEKNELLDTPIDIVKIDTEGFSWEVLMGMGDKINNIKLLHIETETFARHPGHKNNKEIKQFMEHSDFVLVDLSYEWGPLVEDQVWINNRFI